MTTAVSTETDTPRRGFVAPLDLAGPDVQRTIMRLALPSVVGLSINALHHTVNAVFVGMIGAHAMAAISVVFPLMMIVGAIGEGLGVGAAATIGRLLGRGAIGRASVTASTVMAAAVPVGLALTLAILWMRQPLLAALGATADTWSMADSYVGVMAFGATLTLLQIIADFVAIAEGNTRFSMWTLLGGFALNIVLDPILIFWLDMGVAGAALATLLSQIAVLAAYAVYFHARAGRVRVAVRLALLQSAILRPVVALGLPTTLASIVTAIAFAIVYYQAGSFGGDPAIAGLGIALRLLTLGSLPLIGFVLGVQAALSFAYGAGNRGRVLAATRFALTVTSGFALLYGCILVSFAVPIARLFSADPAVQTVAATAIVVIHAAFPLAGIRLAVLVLLQSMGQARRAALVSLAPQGYLLIPLLFVLPPWLGLGGIAVALAIAAALASVLAIVLLIPVVRELGSPVHWTPEVTDIARTS
ncbi:MATE family efflux transporter [Bradyrhizobium iriomotense]|uniref:Multidrug export protein MepA n=1 Tax=Bradyrhizobium iriomotense TaxID=441950 RepID=A0ABQ6AUJ3_9BRAD|nr:MATE family efflux transporter [Bradyrhizobium iriomotense]GLR83543.1 MATE family efflux transporter [Bradyrhizobium iriomotense]